MPRVRDAHTSFFAGELSPLLAARSDRPLYKNGAAKLTNRRVLAQGGTETRPGMRYRATLGATSARLEPFVFNDDQLYAFVFSALQLDVYDPDGVLLATVAAPWTADMLDRLSLVTYGDTTFIVHPDMIPHVVKRTGLATFTIADYAFEVASAGFPMYQPYYKYADPTMTMTPSTTVAGAVTLTLSSPGIWTTSHIGVRVRYKGVEILINSITSATVAEATSYATLAAATADIDWDEAMYSPARGYPVSVTLFGSRLIFGGGASLPDAFCATKVGAYYNFDIGTALDNEAIVETIGDESVAEVRHVVGSDRLLVFADTGVFLVPTSDKAPLTPTTITFRRQSPMGSGWLRPRLFDDAVLYVQKTGTTVREVTWDEISQRTPTEPVSLLAEHLISDPVSICTIPGSSTRPEQYAFLAKSDGAMATLLSERMQKLTAWTPWETEGAFKSLATIGEHVYALVERQLAGGATWTLERFDDAAAALDCSLVASSGTPTRTFTGFLHLAGKTVQCVSRGHYLGEAVVAGDGSITLASTAPEVTEIEAGFGFDQLIRPMPADFDLPDGPARGLMKRMIRALVQVDRSAGFRIQGSTVLLDFQGDDFASAPATRTGIVELRLLGVNRECQFDIEIDTPSKVTVLGLTRDIQING